MLALSASQKWGPRSTLSVRAEKRRRFRFWSQRWTHRYAEDHDCSERGLFGEGVCISNRTNFIQESGIKIIEGPDWQKREDEGCPGIDYLKGQ